MTKFVAVDKNNNIAVATWISAKAIPELTAVAPPYPANITHHIEIQTNSGYPQDFHVFGRIVFGHPNVSFLPGNTGNWDETVPQLKSPGSTASNLMDVSAVTPSARVQVEKIQFDCVWSGRVTSILTPANPEVPLDVS